MISPQSERSLWGYENHQNQVGKWSRIPEILSETNEQLHMELLIEPMVFSVNMRSAWITVSLASIFFNDFKSSTFVCNHIGV
jgi:hypothetical protein